MLYKSQIGIEKNFSFLKDPVIVNSIFLQKAERIEVLWLVLLLSLLIWRLMERSMRKYIEANHCTLTGWEKRQTTKPTAFMMTTKFISMLVITMGRNRQLARPLKDYQRQYLDAMGVTNESTTPAPWAAFPAGSECFEGPGRLRDRTFFEDNPFPRDPR